MSFFLLEINRWAKEIDLEQKLAKESNEPNLNSNECLQKFDACMLKHLIRRKEFTTTFVNEDSDTKTYGVYFNTISKYFNGLLRFVYRKKKKEVSVYFHFLDRNGDYLKIEGMHMYNQVFRTTFLTPEVHRNSVKLLLNVENGSVCFQICYYSSIRSNLLSDMDQGFLYKAKNLIVDLYKNFVEPYIQVFQKALKINIPKEKQTEIDEEPPKLIESILRYTKMMTTKVHLNSAVIDMEQARVSQLKQRQEATKKLFDRKIDLNEDFKKPFILYINQGNKVEKKYPKSTHEFNVSQAEQKRLINILNIQTGKNPEKPGNTHQNILNFIQILDPNKMQTSPLNLGGFSFIHYAEVNFKYVDSFSTQKDETTTSNRPLMTKRMAIKMENRPHGKNFHEYKILTEMRNGINALFPKYFIPVNIPQYSFKEGKPLLMMEFLSDGNLVEYMKNRKKCVSLLSKIYILFSISMALRHLQSYKIVHLDIKPNNIMLSPGLVIKIIDFGESFHPTIWKEEGKNYRPGFTLPYSPPQFATGVRHGFTSKADVYSFGVMMFEILYGRVPFENREKLFLGVENCDVYGDSAIIRLLNWMISRCLSRNPELRPEMDWISIILRLSLEVIT